MIRSPPGKDAICAGGIRQVARAEDVDICGQLRTFSEKSAGLADLSRKPVCNRRLPVEWYATRVAYLCNLFPRVPHSSGFRSDSMVGISSATVG